MSIAACLTLIFFIVLTLAYVHSFLQIKKALTQTTNNQVSVRAQVVYVVILFFLAILQMGLMFIDFFQFSLVFLIMQSVAKFFRFMAIYLIQYQNIQFS